MKIQGFLFIAALLLLAKCVQDTEGGFGVLPPGRRELQRKVCIPGIKCKNISQALRLSAKWPK